MSKEIKLSVNDLKISFRTDAGKVQAVRNISFDLYKGETLAIVGESGSGKSVTSKAIMGISAGNSILEGGEILYDGQDLLRIPEEEMHKLRGDKVAMIFQDPLSSLNPIMRIGQQITEAMLLKNKANRKEGREAFKNTMALLSSTAKEAIAQNSGAGLTAADVDNYVKSFDSFSTQAMKLENSYNASKTAAEELVAIIKDSLFLAEKKQPEDVMAMLNLVEHKLKDMLESAYFAGSFTKQVNDHMTALKDVKKAEKAKVTAGDTFKKVVLMATIRKNPEQATVSLLGRIQNTAEQMIAQEEYDFFSVGYYLSKNPKDDLSTMPAAQANAKAGDFFNKDFLTGFTNMERIAVRHSSAKALENKKHAITTLRETIDFFKAGNFNEKDAKDACKKATKSVMDSIDQLAVIKDNVAYTFGGALEREVDNYFFYIKNNPKEELRFERQTAKREALLAKGKQVDWKVVPKSIIEPEEQIETIVLVISRVLNKFMTDVENEQVLDVDKRCAELIDYLKGKASQVVDVLTKRIAKEKAIKLMEEVGIPEARVRYRQYPFEFSGGMRQRIVIAIALSANPDILICDEPTTALDVTIQAQILELINRLKKQHNLSIIFITHDLGVVANMADRIAVMYAGKIVEYGTANEVFYNPQHPYTWALLASMPDLDTSEKLDAIPGTPPNMIYPPVGDAFAERNKYAMEIDFEQQPPMFEVSPTHYAATWLLHPNAPKVEMPKIITERIKRMEERGGKYGE